MCLHDRKKLTDVRNALPGDSLTSLYTSEDDIFGQIFLNVLRILKIYLNIVHNECSFC